MEYKLYNVELNIKGLDERLIEHMKAIAKRYRYEAFNHGKDRLVFTSENGIGFTYMINEISNVCETYGVDYVSLLDLD